MVYWTNTLIPLAGREERIRAAMGPGELRRLEIRLKQEANNPDMGPTFWNRIDGDGQRRTTLDRVAERDALHAADALYNELLEKQRSGALQVAVAVAASGVYDFDATVVTAVRLERVVVEETVLKESEGS